MTGEAVNVASEPLGVDANAPFLPRAIVLDVRRAATFAQAGSMLPGARWVDPAALDAWAPTLPAGAPVLVYCVHGHEVSRTVALRLVAAGHLARFLRGGIEGWIAAGRPTAAKPPASAGAASR